MKTSDAGLKLIRQFEGLRLKAYRCPAGIWTIGYGHTSAAGAPEVREAMRISREEADTILKRDLAQFEGAVTSMVKVPTDPRTSSTPWCPLPSTAALPRFDGRRC